MIKTMRLLALAVAVTVAAVLGTTVARAESINFAGNITLDQGGAGCGATSPCQSITFSQLTVLSTTPGGSSDPVVGTSASITGNIDYVSTAGTQFSPASATLSLGSATAGTLTGTVDFLDLTGASGYFVMDVGLSGLSVTTGSSSVLDAWAGSTSGNGILTFQFLGVANMADLLSLSGSSTTTVSASIVATPSTSSVPEPSTLLLFGTALLAGAFMFRKLYYSAEASR